MRLSNLLLIGVVGYFLFRSQQITPTATTPIIKGGEVSETPAPYMPTIKLPRIGLVAPEYR